MRRMSFRYTPEAMRAKSKTVTRRSVDTWATLKRGDRVLAVVQAQGLRRGEKQEPLGVIEVMSVIVEDVRGIGQMGEMRREGLSTGRAAVDAFISAWFRTHKTYRCRRIEFRHVEAGA